LAVTAVEFLYPLRGRPQPTQVVAALYFMKHIGPPRKSTAMSRDVVQLLERAGLTRGYAPMNGGRALSRAIPQVHQLRPKGAWEITETGEKFVRQILEIEDVPDPPSADAAKLHALAETQTNDHVKGYIEEAIKCYEAGALRAAVVFVWTGAVRTLQEAALAKGKKASTEALQKHDSKARTIRSVDDFAYVKEKTLLFACVDLGVIDKGEKGMLIQALELRNNCGHPTKYRPRQSKVDSFVEDVVGIVFD